MNDDTRFDPVDDELARRFAHGGASPSDPDVVLDAMRPRLQRARTRRRASFAGAAAGLAAVVVLVVALGNAGGGGGSVTTPPASRGPVRTAPTAPTSPTTAPSGGSATPDTLPEKGGEDAVGVIPTVPDATPPTNAPPQTSAPEEQHIVQAWYPSDGGSIAVDLVDGRVSLASSAPAAGFTAEVHDNGPSRVEVRFTNGGTEWRIRVDVVNGQLVPEVTQH